MDLAIWIFLPTLTLYKIKIHILVISMCFNSSCKVIEFRTHLQCKKKFSKNVTNIFCKCKENVPNAKSKHAILLEGIKL